MTIPPEFQHSTHTKGHSAGGHALTPLITGSAPTMRAYLINRNVPPLPHTLSPHLQHLYFYAHFKLHYLTTDNLNGSSLPHQVSDLGHTAQSLLFLSHRHCSPAAQKADPRERWQLSWALGGECEGHELPEPPPLHWSAKSSGFSRGHKDAVETKAQKEPPILQGKKPEFCLHKIQLNKSQQFCT